MIKQILITALALLLVANIASALTINSVDADVIEPGQTGKIRIEVENNLDDDAVDISFSLKMENLPFIPFGSSEQSVDKIKENDEEVFVFTVKTSSGITPGDYEIPYALSYTINGGEKSKSGTLGVRVKANPILTYSVETENPVIDTQGKLTFKIVNKGFSDARFVSIKVLSDGLTLLSDDEVYIGSVDSDDFETAAFDVIFKKINPTFSAVVEYKDFDNNLVTENINLPVTVYTKEKALELGIIKPSYTIYYAGGALVIIILWFVWRSVKKRRRLRKSMENSRR